MFNNSQRQTEVATEAIKSKTGKYLSPFQLKFLTQKLKTDLRPEYRRRIEIMLLADLGISQSEICKTLNCSNETARFWIGMVKAGQVHQWDNVPIGRPKTVNDRYVRRLQELVSHSPREFGYSFHRWTARWLSKHLAKELEIDISDRHINRLLKSMGLSTRSNHPSNTFNRQAEDFGLVIKELNSESRSNSVCLGPY